MSEYEGPERRSDKISVRLALLEQAELQAEARHIENKASLVSVHKRVTEIKDKVSEIKHEVVAEVRIGLDAISVKMDDKEEDCKEHLNRTALLENNGKWLFRWLAASWALILTALGIAIQHHDTVKSIKP